MPLARSQQHYLLSSSHKKTINFEQRSTSAFVSEIQDFELKQLVEYCGTIFRENRVQNSCMRSQQL